MQRFAARADLERAHCTIEEREEYEPHIERGATVFAGVDYAAVLDAAARDAEVIVWDGGNNDFPFVRPDLHIVLVDPMRAGHETGLPPGRGRAAHGRHRADRKVRHGDTRADRAARRQRARH